ncbi:MAG: GHKL domain-containing protein, partial [Geodermatophilaceae bacterium]|nr:GHKL domain-containing protein [Geodermatophilaceae bacterium]
LPPDAVGRPLAELGLPADLVAAVLDPAGAPDQLVVTSERVVAVSAAAVTAAADRGAGRVVTLRDRTDLQELTGELDSARGLAAALSSQAHESANRLHTVISLVELGRPDEAVSFAVAELRLAQGLTDQVLAAVEEPVLAALLLGKSAVAAERGVELTLDTGAALDAGRLDAAGINARDLVTVLGNLIDNALDAVGTSDVRRVAVTLHQSGDAMLVRVADTGEGLDPEVARHAFERGWTTKSRGPDRLHGRGLGLALVGQTVTRLGGEVTVEPEPSHGGAVFTVRIPLALGSPDTVTADRDTAARDTADRAAPAR